MNHPTEQELTAYHDGEIGGELSAERYEAVAAHLLLCKLCMDQLEQLKQMSSMIASSAPAISQIAMHRIHAKLEDVLERGLIRWAWEVSGIAAAVLLAGSIWLLQATEPAKASTASASVPPWVATNASIETTTAEAATPAAQWYLADARNSSEVNP